MNRRRANVLHDTGHRLRALAPGGVRSDTSFASLSAAPDRTWAPARRPGRLETDVPSDTADDVPANSDRPPRTRDGASEGGLTFTDTKARDGPAHVRHLSDSCSMS